MPSFLPRLFIIGLVLYALSCGIRNTDNFASVVEAANEDAVVLLENETSSLAINLFGGAFTDFHLKNKPINPLSWQVLPEKMPENNQNGAPFRGHFLCLGRWGSPSEGEIAAGIPHNGEQSNTFWALKENNNALSIKLYNEAPLDGLTVTREVHLSPESPVFKVVESFKNVNTLGRVSNVVQHPTLGPPFLSSSTRVFSNAGKGFLQKLSYPEPEKHAFDWPNIDVAEENIQVDFSRSDHGFNGVATHIFNKEDTTGWIAAYSPDSQLMMGYVWDTREYPWLNVWHHEVDGEVKAKGLEFGTTGIGRPYKDLLMQDTRFFGHNSFEYIDAGEQIVKSYYCFLVEVDNPQSEVTNVALEDGKLIVYTSDQGQKKTVALNLPE